MCLCHTDDLTYRKHDVCVNIIYFSLNSIELLVLCHCHCLLNDTPPSHCDAVGGFGLSLRDAFTVFFQRIHDNEVLDELFADLDQNGDLEIDFKEFITLIAMVTSACHELFTPSHRSR